MKPSVLADVAREYVGVVGKLWLQKSGIGQIRGKMQEAAGKMRTEKQFSKENEKQNGQEGLNKQQRRSCQKEKFLKIRKMIGRQIYTKKSFYL